MVALLALGLVLVKVLGSGKPHVSQARAVEIARARVDFKPEDHQIRFVRRGIPSRGFWVVSFYIRNPEGGYKRVTVVLVDAQNGEVTEVRRST
jgi:hypothetical protein